MTVIFGIFAGIILIVYSLYFVHIIKGSYGGFEQEMLTAFAGWMVDTGAAARRTIWVLIVLSVVLEIAYFIFTLLVIDNVLLLTFTGAFILMETLHVYSMIVNFIRFFAGTIVLKQLFAWRVERLSATLFFTHSFLVLASLIFF